jgi:hypothetical protein
MIYGLSDSAHNPVTWLSTFPEVDYVVLPRLAVLTQINDQHTKLKEDY